MGISLKPDCLWQLSVATRTFYGTSMTGACQNAALRAFESITVTWQLYWPGASAASETLNCTGSVFSFEVVPSVTDTGGVSKAFVCPRYSVTNASSGCVFSAPGS